MDDGRRSLVEEGEAAGNVMQYAAFQAHREGSRSVAWRRLGVVRFGVQQTVKARHQLLHNKRR